MKATVIGLGRGNTWLLAAVGAIVVLAPAGQGVGLLAYHEPGADESTHVGLAHEDTEDDWHPGGPCTAAIQAFTFTLVVEEPVEGEAELRLTAPEIDEGGDLQQRSVTAEPGEPATLEVTQPNGCEDFTVSGENVDTVVEYRVHCQAGSGGPCTQGAYVP